MIFCSKASFQSLQAVLSNRIQCPCLWHKPCAQSLLRLPQRLTCGVLHISMQVGLRASPWHRSSFCIASSWHIPFFVCCSHGHTQLECYLMMAFCGEWPDIVSPCNNELATCTAVEQRELKSALRPDHVLHHVKPVLLDEHTTPTWTFSGCLPFVLAYPCYPIVVSALWHMLMHVTLDVFQRSGICTVVKSLNDVRTLQYMQTLISAAERHLGFFARAGSITGKATLTLVLLGQAYVLKPEIT